MIVLHKHQASSYFLYLFLCYMNRQTSLQAKSAVSLCVCCYDACIHAKALIVGYKLYYSSRPFI